MSLPITLIDVAGSLRDRVWKNKIALRNVVMADKTKYGQYVLAIMGRLHVANLTYEKHVFVRVTFDNWATFEDFPGSYLESSNDGTGDVFTFGFTRKDKDAFEAEFALCCIQGGFTAWDNNSWKNYKFSVKENPFKRK